MTDYIIYTDGAHSSKTNNGGIGVVIIDNNNQQQHLSKGYSNTTNNRMELRAALYGLKHIPKNSSATIFSDSKYLIDSFNKKWIDKWQRNQWKNSEKKPIKNIDIWIEILDEIKEKTIIWNWVKGHNDNEFNELADKLATKAREKDNLIPEHKQIININEHSLPQKELIQYIEFTVNDIKASKDFFSKVFNWEFKDWNEGEEYIEIFGAGIKGGFYQKENSTPSRNNFLIIFHSDNLEYTKQKIQSAGGIINKNTFSYPGGKRFHFLDPSNNEFAVSTNTQ